MRGVEMGRTAEGTRRVFDGMVSINEDGIELGT